MTRTQIPEGKFYIGFGENFYKVDPIIFAKQSGKFKRECVGKSELEFEEPVADETFKAFLSSCQLRNFQIKPLYLLELLAAARAWECPNLEQYCMDACKANGIVYRPSNDVLGRLLTAIDEGRAKQEQLQELADCIDDFFEDDRLPDLEPEILFRVIIMAEKKGFSMEKYIKFVMSIIKTEPETATLLALRINFDLLPEDQENMIFHCPTIHEMSIGFFVAMALSNVRYHGNLGVEGVREAYSEVLRKFREGVENKKRTIKQELDEEHEHEMDTIITVLEKQHAIIEELSDILADQAVKLESGPLSLQGQGDARITKIEMETENSIKQMDEVVDDTLKEDGAGFEEKIASVVEREKARWIAKMTDPVKLKEDQDNKLSDISDIVSRQQEKRQQLQSGIKELKSALCAKIVRDKLRCMKGFNRNKDLYGAIFDTEEEIWGLSSADVKSASKNIIEKIEKRLEDECPIRKVVSD